MKKVLKHWLLAIFAVILAATFTACSGDEPDPNPTPEPNPEPETPAASSQFRLKAIKDEDGSIFSNIEYDESGRIISLLRYDKKCKISYSENKITTIVESLTDGFSTVNYTLKNGLIVKAVETTLEHNTEWQYSYEIDYTLDGYIKSINCFEGNTLKMIQTFTYDNNGQLTENFATIYNEDAPNLSYNSKFTYTDIPTTIGFNYIYCSDLMEIGDDVTAVLLAEGYFGELPKYLVSKVVITFVEMGKEYYETEYYGYLMNLDGTINTSTYNENVLKYFWY